MEGWVKRGFGTLGIEMRTICVCGEGGMEGRGRPLHVSFFWLFNTKKRKKLGLSFLDKNPEPSN